MNASICNTCMRPLIWCTCAAFCTHNGATACPRCDGPVRLADAPTMQAALEHAFGADAPSYAELARQDNAPADAWQYAQDDYERQLYGAGDL